MRFIYRVLLCRDINNKLYIHTDTFIVKIAYLFVIYVLTYEYHIGFNNIYFKYIYTRTHIKYGTVQYKYNDRCCTIQYSTVSEILYTYKNFAVLSKSISPLSKLPLVTCVTVIIKQLS